jgi:hypothetical protein
MSMHARWRMLAIGRQSRPGRFHKRTHFFTLADPGSLGVMFSKLTWQPSMLPRSRCHWFFNTDQLAKAQLCVPFGGHKAKSDIYVAARMGGAIGAAAKEPKFADVVVTAGPRHKSAHPFIFHIHGISLCLRPARTAAGHRHNIGRMCGRRLLRRGNRRCFFERKGVLIHIS